MHTDESIRFDAEHIWHPYNRLPPALPSYLVESAQGVRLKLADGRELIDGMSSWWAAIHGYNHPALNRAMVDQAQRMCHVMFGGLTHEPAVTLCRKLLDMTHPDLDKVFISDSGSVSVEIAIKMALQFWQARGDTKKTKLLTVKGGYHGDTFTAMSVCDPVNGMHHLFNDVLTQQLFADLPRCRFDQPWDDCFIKDFREKLSAHSDDVAAVILEPVVQGAGGMRFYSPEYRKNVRQLCDEYGVLLILDEIATGFGRSGKLFAYEYADIAPDIMCVGKALTGGCMSLAATLCTAEISDTICGAEPGLFMHGPTFMANPLACAVASRSLDLLFEHDWERQVTGISHTLKEQLEPAASLSGVHDVRVLGAIGVIELEAPVDTQIIQPIFVDNGVWIRPFGKLVYTMPPYVIEAKDLQYLCQQMIRTLEHYLHSSPKR